MSRVLAVTGTDTGVGKTRVACALLHAARAAGLRAAGYKPVASGCERTPQGLRNDDALALLAASTPGLDYQQVNPVAFEAAIAPHIAAAREGRPIAMPVLDAGLDRLQARHDLVVLEGAGGWRVPLAPDEDFASWMQRRGLPVLLVVGLRVGAINHALLSAEALRASGCWTGWVANHLPEDDSGTAREMIHTLSGSLGPPHWQVACGETAEAAAARVPVALLPGAA